MVEHNTSQLRDMAIGHAEDLTATSTTFLTCLLPACIKLLITSLPGELRLAPYAPSPGWPIFVLCLSFHVHQAASNATQGALCKAAFGSANYVVTPRSHSGLR